MPRSFPSQIVDYLRKIFVAPREFDQATIQSYIGSVAGFLHLYDGLPAELIRLPADRYAHLVHSIETIRYGTDQFRLGNSPDCLRPVGPALGRAWRIMESLKDQVPSTGHDLSFITDAVLQEMIGLDISAIAADLASGEWKGATILAGSCCEALLLYGLQAREAKAPGLVGTAVAAISWPRGRAPDAHDLTARSWDLFSYTEIAGQLSLISADTKHELASVRNYRNLIQPAKTVREQVNCDRGTALIGVGALEHVVSDLRRNL
jgi:hypothetical protein